MESLFSSQISRVGDAQRETRPAGGAAEHRGVNASVLEHMDSENRQDFDGETEVRRYFPCGPKLG
jgi:hypothetical protein